VAPLGVLGRHYTYHAPSAAALTFFTAMDGHQDSGRPAVRSDESPGYLIFTDRDAILDGFQQPDLWSSCALDPTEPDPPYAMIPIQLDPAGSGEVLASRTVRDLSAGSGLVFENLGPHQLKGLPEQIEIYRVITT
jgi:hypothetical protein